MYGGKKWRYLTQLASCIYSQNGDTYMYTCNIQYFYYVL